MRQSFALPVAWLRVVRACAVLAFVLWTAEFRSASAADGQGFQPPNIIFVLADDLGYGDLGCYGQKRIRTPHLDRLAGEGIRFTRAYAGSTVCAPSRCSLITGKHTGHATIRGNRPDRNRPETPIRLDEITLAEVLKPAGYQTAIIGKWGVGENGSTGAPYRRGFDLFLGYQTQFAAHDYHPEFLWRNETQFPLAANASGQRGDYSHDILMREALAYVRAHRDDRFFLYLPLTIPHANNEERPNGMQVPDDEPYSNQPWPQTEKNFAAMITRMDRGIGQLMELLKELGIDDRTMVFFTSDNGPHSEGGHDAAYFESNGGLRGIKRDLYEGGIRVPLIARWPGAIRPGTVSDDVVAFWDFLPTFAALAGQPRPPNVDGVSIVPVLLNNERIARRPLYWEFYERGAFVRAALMDDWKGVSPGSDRPLELYDLVEDPFEQRNVANEHPNVVRRLQGIMEQEHTPNPIWPRPEQPTSR